MGDSKEWWKSRNIWTAIVIILIGVYNSVDVTLGPAIGIDLPNIPEWIYALLGALGIYTRVTASKTIK